MTKTLGLTLLLAFSATFASAQDWQKLCGARTGVKEPQTVVVKTQAEWTALWAKHAGSEAAAPAVDFSKEMVVGVFLGERHRAGYAVDLKLVELPAFVDEAGAQADTLIVIYSERAPQTEAGAAVVTAPFALAKVRRHAAVAFERESAARALDKLRGAVQAPRFDN